jgi:hypothetical protein
MEATELRIGNKVQPKPEDRQRYGTMCEVTQVYKGGFTVDYHYPGAWFEPIPLTPDILEKAGFVLDGFKQYRISINPFDSGTKDLCFSGDYLYLEEGSGKPGSNDIVTLWNKDLMKNFYLHQLQNLIFALTGEELNINL